MKGFATVFQQALALILLALPIAVLTGAIHPRAPVWDDPPLEPGQVRLATALGWEDVLWLDARGRTEYEGAHIPGALLLNEDEWDTLFFNFLDVWHPEQRVVIYCGGTECQKSQQVAERLRKDLGSDKVYVLRGGWREWSQR